jgi:hypothetical protein
LSRTKAAPSRSWMPVERTTTRTGPGVRSCGEAHTSTARWVGRDQSDGSAIGASGDLSKAFSSFTAKPSTERRSLQRARRASLVQSSPNYRSRAQMIAAHTAAENKRRSPNARRRVGRCCRSPSWRDRACLGCPLRRQRIAMIVLSCAGDEARFVLSRALCGIFGDPINNRLLWNRNLSIRWILLRRRLRHAQAWSRGRGSYVDES